MAGTHEELRLRKPSHGTAKVGAVHGEHLKLVCNRSAHVTGNAGGFTIPFMTKGIYKCGKPGFSHRKLFDCAQRDPAFIRGVSPHRRKKISDDGSD
jgi:hypothetical protein